MEEFLGEKFRRISQEFLETESQTCDPPKIFHLGDQFWGISREFPRNQLQEMVLEKFSGNSSKKVTSVGESGEIPHFCYLGTGIQDVLYNHQNSCQHFFILFIFLNIINFSENHIMLIGGWDYNFNVVSLVEIYSIEDGFIAELPSMPTAR